MARRSARGSAAAFAVSVPLTLASAQTVERFSLSLNGTGGVATNPFLAEGGDNAGAYAEAGLTSSYTVREETGGAELRASVRGARYSGGQGGSYDLRAQLSADRRLSEALTVSASAAAQSSIVGERGVRLDDVLAPPGDAAAPNPGPADELFDPLDPDLDLLGERARQNAISARLDLGYRPFPEDQLQLSIGATKSSFPGADAGIGSRSLSGSLSYGRQLSPTATVGVTAQVEQARFGGQRGTSTIFQPQLTYSGLVYPGWDFSLGFGASFVEDDAGGGPARRSGGLSGQVRACRAQIRLQFCLSGTRGAQTGGRGSISVRTTASAQLGYVLSERERLGLTGTLGRSEQSSDQIGLRDEGVRQQSLQADYRLQWRERREIGVTASYRDLYRDGPPVKADFAVTATLSVGLER
jgi:hypothetical protein